MEEEENKTTEETEAVEETPELGNNAEEIKETSEDAEVEGAE